MSGTIMISQMPTEVTIDGTEIIPTLQGGINKTMNMAQLLAYITSALASEFAPVATNPLLATLEAVYPVGSVYLNANQATNPATLFGFGSWALQADNFIIGAGGSYSVGATGGESTHTLTTAEMPAHNHNYEEPAAIGEQATGPTGNYSTAGLSNQVTASTGGGSAHNNMPPYIAYYIWVREA
jgi:hypothetical protein